MKQIADPNQQASINVGGVVILTVWTLLISAFLSSVLFATGEENGDRDAISTDRNIQPERSDDVQTDRAPERDRNQNGEVDRDRLAWEETNDRNPERKWNHDTQDARTDRVRIDTDDRDVQINRLSERDWANLKERIGDRDMSRVRNWIDENRDRVCDDDGECEEGRERKCPQRERPVRERPDTDRPVRERPDSDDAPDHEQIRITIARLRAAAENGDEDAALKLRHLLARLDAAKDPEPERPVRERPDPKRERTDRDDVPKRERPVRERPDPAELRTIIQRLRAAAENGNEDAALKLRHIMARLDS